MLVSVGPRGTESAVANGDTRTIHLHHSHTGEDIAATYMKDGRYDPAVLQALNHFLRDWRNDDETHMDPRLFDVIWETYRESGSHQPIWVVSAYRSPVTNAMLHRRSRTVAKHSQHMLGKAMDMHYLDVPMSRIREIGMRLERGGVGYYPRAGTPFVHLDVGGVRYWPRMTYAQLMHLFPDGKTVFRAADGRTLPHYEEAVAELEQRGQDVVQVADAKPRTGNFFTRLFHIGSDEAEDGFEASADPAAATARPVRTASLGQATAIEPLPPAPPAATAVPTSEAYIGTPQQIADRDELADAMPVPPHRPSGLAMPDASAEAPPVPPARPVELAALEARPTRAARVDRIAGLIGTLPGLITGGSRHAAPAAAPGRPDALAYAPVARPVAIPDLPGAFPGASGARLSDLIPARLDRSNFHGLTGKTSLLQIAPHTALGRGLVPLRVAVRFDVRRIGFDPHAHQPSRFDARPAIPATEHFVATAASRPPITR